MAAMIDKKLIRTEIRALKRLAKANRDDPLAQLCIDGQIDVLTWALGWPLETP
jgi:hypothetical protein